MDVTKAKAIIAAIGVFVEALKVILMDNVFEVNEFASLASSFVILITTVILVYRVPNHPTSVDRPDPL
jgi:hypothetical protein